MHDWNTVNREVHEPADLTVADVVEEIRVALATMDESTFVAFVEAIDKGNYLSAGSRLGAALRDMNNPPRGEGIRS